MTRQETAGALADSVEVRERLVEALNLDLIGPWGGHALAAERLPGWVRPSNWYLTGFLIPSGTKPESSADADEQDDIDETPESSGLAEESSEERKAAKKGFFPSSMGLSFLVAADADALAVIVRWGDYEPARVEGADGKSDSAWVRESNERTVPVALSGAGAHRRGDHAVPDSAGLTLHVDERPIRTDALAEIPAGTRSVSVFLVNGRAPDDDNPDRNYAFQAEIEVRGRQPFVPRPDPRGVQAAGWDDRVADLHYADTPEYATGHGVSADWEVVEGACRMLRTAWIPRADVEETKTAGVPGAVLSMDALGALPDAQTARVALRPLVDQYRVWIELRRAEIETLPDARRETAGELLRLAGIAADRMERGIAMLAADADVLDAFRLMNRAVARALRQRLGEQFTTQPPGWRAFQLAFILLNLPGLADPRDPDRETVDLLFFPTGGGKTEAYLGLAALAMVLRRLRNPGPVFRARASASSCGTRCACSRWISLGARPASFARWNWNAQPTSRDTASGRSRSASGSARRRRPTSWGGRATIDRTRRGPERGSTRRTPRASPLRSRSRAVPGAGRGSLPTRLRCGRTTTGRRSCASSARRSHAISAATGRCRSSPWTSRSTAAFRRS